MAQGNEKPDFTPGIRLLSWLFSTSVFAACCALALTLSAEKLLAHGRMLPLLSPLHLLIVGCTLVEYNIHFLLNKKVVEMPATAMPYSRWWHHVMCAAGVILCAVSLLHLNRALIILLVVLGVLALLYSAPSLPFRPKRRLNDFGITKILVLTATWVVVTTVFPALYLNTGWRQAIPEILFRSLLIFPLCLAFDQRDVLSDKAAGIQTLAVALGEHRSYRVMYGILELLIAIVIYGWDKLQEGHSEYNTANTVRALNAVISCGAALWAIRYSRRHPHPFVYSGLIDGVMLLYGVLGMLS